MYVGSLTGSRTYFFTGAGNHLLVGPVVNSTNGAPIALSKSGTGMLILEGVNTYTNGTALAGGTLLVDGSLPAGSLTISSGTTLGGNGHLYPVVTLPSTATLSPGDNSGITVTNDSSGGIFTNNYSVGLLTIHNNVTLQAGSTCFFEIDQSSAATNDQLVVTGALNYGGKLVVTNLSGTARGRRYVPALQDRQFIRQFHLAYRLARPGAGLEIQPDKRGAHDLFHRATRH